AEVERRGHVSEALAHPLVATGTEPHSVAPPLMCDLVRRNDLPIASIAKVHAKLMSNSGIEVIADGNPDQSRPCLAEVAGRLLGNLEMCKRRWTEILGVKLDRKLAFGKRFLVEGRRA